MQREYYHWWSEHLQREMELLVFGHGGAKVLVFPTRRGRFYEYESMGLVATLADKIAQGYLQLYCIDSVDHESFYCGWVHPSGRIQRHMAFEAYILDEVFPFMHSRNPHDCVIAYGASLGAFHAANIVFRHPQLFKKLVAFSGRYDLTLAVEDFYDLFDGFYNDDIYFHTPSHFLPSLECSQRLSHLREMDITLVIGKEDPFLQNNEHLSRILQQKGIPHQLWVWEGRAHSARYWRRMAAIYI
jgi:esterase/lipase superfamily enzyme